MLKKYIISENSARKFFEREIYKVAHSEEKDITDDEIDSLMRILESNSLVDEDEYPFIGRFFMQSWGNTQMKDTFEAVISVWIKAKNMFNTDDRPKLEISDIDNAKKMLQKLREWKYIRFYQKNTEPTPELSTMTWDEALQNAENMYD